MHSSRGALDNGGGVKIVKVYGEETKEELLWLRGVLESGYGPWGSHLILQPMEGGAITRTRHTHQMLGMLKPHNPLLKLIISHLQAHSQCYRDGTLYAGLLATNLILQGLRLGVARLVASQEVCRVMCEVCEWLQGDSCVRYQLDLSSSTSLVALLSSFIAPKLSHLPQSSTQHLAALLLQGVLKALPHPSSESSSQTTSIVRGRVSVLPLPHATTSKSILCDGVLLSEEAWHSVCLVRHEQVRRDVQGLIRTMLFSSSLAGDDEGGVGFGRMEVWLEEVGSVSMEEEAREALLCAGHALVQRGVGLLICQKCIHPSLKDYLIEKGVLVLERVSGVRVQSVHALCGGSMISDTSLHALGEAQLGVVKDVKIMNHLDRKFVQLIGMSHSHSTLLVCADSERNAEEIEVLCNDALRVCEWCLGDPVVVCGAGCMDTAAAHLLRTKIQEAQEKSDRSSEGTQVLHMVCTSFEQQALALHGREGNTVLTDSAYHHCWTLPPGAVRNGGKLEEREVDGDERVGGRNSRWSDMIKGTCCSCGGVAFSGLPPCTTWRRLSPQPSFTSSSSAPQLSTTEHLHPKLPPVNSSTTCDLLTPRLAALQCAAELVQSVLTTAYTVSCHQ